MALIDIVESFKKINTEFCKITYTRFFSLVYGNTTYTSFHSLADLFAADIVANVFQRKENSKGMGIREMH